MEQGNSGNRFSTEVRARAVRMVLENEADYKSAKVVVATGQDGVVDALQSEEVRKIAKEKLRRHLQLGETQANKR